MKPFQWLAKILKFILCPYERREKIPPEFREAMRSDEPTPFVFLNEYGDIIGGGPSIREYLGH